MDKSEEASELLSPSKAAALIYVYPETLRRYETKGLIKSFRTAGGHRRYKEEYLQLLKKNLER